MRAVLNIGCWHVNKVETGNLQGISRTKRWLLRLVVAVGFIWILLPFILKSFKEKGADLPDNVIGKIQVMKKKTANTTVIEAVEKDIGVKKVMKNRQDIMKKACHKHGLDMKGSDPLHQPNPWEFFINKDHHLVWCNVFKSGSRSWMYNFNILAGYTPHFLKSTKEVDGMPLSLARAKYNRPSLGQLLKEMNRSDSVSFIIARHPFERLISGYRDRIVKAHKGSKHDKMRRKIIKNYRPPIKRVEFSSHYAKHRTSLIPTFKEFVRFVIGEMEGGKEFDHHWVPVYCFCNPCQVNFKVIAKFETLQRDLEFVIESANIGQLIKVEKLNEAKDGWKSANLATTYLKDLGEQLYKKIVQIYRVDMEIFGYEIKNYKDL